MRLFPSTVMFLALLMASSQSVSAAELRCLATTGMIGDLVKAVVGDRGQVEVLMSSGVDPHLYQPTRSDLAKVLAADVIFYNGLHLEGRMDEAFARARKSGRANASAVLGSGLARCQPSAQLRALRTVHPCGW